MTRFALLTKRCIIFGMLSRLKLITHLFFIVVEN
jgi:hypothetical protein